MRLRLAAAAVLLSATAASAHTGATPSSGFLHGFLHPIGGLDHILAMVAVGLFAALLGGRALTLVPAAFVAAMAAGGALGVFGVGLPSVEIGIALSVVVIGGAVAFGRPVPTALAMGIVAVFAVFHGHAHGAEMPAAASGLAYGVGFVLATSLLHVAGIALGFGAAHLGRAQGVGATRLGGAALSLAGLVLLSAAV